MFLFCCLASKVNKIDIHDIFWCSVDFGYENSIGVETALLARNSKIGTINNLLRGLCIVQKNN